ncbi:hypothetical protein [Haloarcula japonica]|uniref:Uncharacterized protein n=1 Tax=Haloarcula japonica (strain ATCC 49778 / DSM 6131 / JCM 7785 / NBRC 101032 / NCIMB 13157 / TR-1) TaxID=1227453 RepID=M0LJD0_HALJT|nr:hypothetical protein [Haloarcula japonica]EMA33636.1 hypothetical protein C444_04347 [Haloarcula japonica DSM 6131]
MPDYRRDAGFALLCGLVLVAYLRQMGALGALWSESAITVGVAVALGVEALFVLDTPVVALWERRGMRAASAVAFIGVWVGSLSFWAQSSLLRRAGGL